MLLRPHEKLKKFKDEQLPVIDRVCMRAKELVAEWYAIDFNDPGSCLVDLRLYSQLTPKEKGETHCLAQLFRYQRLNPKFKRGRTDYFRIALYDHKMLDILSLYPTLALEPFLTYILTHEYVHVARFMKFLEIFDLDLNARQAEEDLVHQQTHEILFGRPLEGLPLVLELYQNYRLPLD